MGDRAAERGQAEAQRDREDLRQPIRRGAAHRAEASGQCGRRSGVTNRSPFRYQRATHAPAFGRDDARCVAKVLIVEDDEVIAQGMARHLASAGFDPLWVAKGESGLARLRFERPDVCVLDLMLPGSTAGS